MARWKVILGFVVFMILAGIAGRMDMEDEIRQAVVYCDMVEAGHWPDYNQTAQYCDKTRAAYAQYVEQ